jgi:hypothetical protein
MRRTTASSERGGSGGLVPGKKICTLAVEELDRVLQMVVDLAFLDHKRGRVR